MEYDGTRYSGWQEQKNARTVAGEIQSAAQKILGEEIELDGAGRTDSGVHALAQVARLKAKKELKPVKLLNSLNQILPGDIHIISAEAVGPRFHPRHDAVRRFYLYQISLRRSAFWKKYVWWIREHLDLKAMQKASSLVVGAHDFERFADKRSEEGSTIVVVDRIEMEHRGSMILIRIGASHFLWKMVRRIVGCLAQVGARRLSVDDFAALLNSAPLVKPLDQFSVASSTAPSSGLFLERVVYDDGEDPGPLAPALPNLFPF